MLWLGRTALGSYLLGWAHVMSRRWRKLRVANVNRPLASTGPEVDARLPCSRLAINLHMKLTLVFFLSTWVCLAISQVTWWTRYTRCRVDAPHIFALATILLVVANLSWLVYFLVQLTLSIKQMIQWFRANQPAIGKLSQSTVDRIPLIVYHHGGRDCNAFARPELHSACISPERNTASIRASIQSSLVAFVRSFYGSSGQTPVLLQADDEEGTEETPLVSWANSSQDTASIPDVNIPQDARCTICLCAFAPPASTDGPSDPSQRSTSSASPLLRLLSCGHVYHKECIDPWLTQRSGRCPYCQKPVDVSQPSSVQRRFWARLWR
ncbi:hypothetical protein FKP32DRAFT_1587551 [Trametes sanguinea]|nr:hypothetical protein FKP32DRAFT_1587551 [Trametes sanguinea]